MSASLFILFLALVLDFNNSESVHCTTGLCREQVLNCRDNDTCQVICDGNESCSSATINANTATDVMITIMCFASNTCAHDMDIKCGTGHCVLQCIGDQSCVDLGHIDVSLSTSFQCVGDCPDTFSSYSLPQTVIRSTKTTTAVSQNALNNSIILIVFLICLLCIITVLLFGCCSCYFRMHQRYVALKYNDPMDSKSSVSNVSSPRTPSVLSPISEEIPQFPTYVTRLHAPHATTAVPMEQNCDEKTVDVASWIHQNVDIKYPVTPVEHVDNAQYKESISLSTNTLTMMMDKDEGSGERTVECLTIKIPDMRPLQYCDSNEEHGQNKSEPMTGTKDDIMDREFGKRHCRTAQVEELDHEDVFHLVQRVTADGDETMGNCDGSNTPSSETFEVKDNPYVDMKLYLMKPTSRSSPASELHE